MITYIRQNIPGFYIEFPEEIDALYWEGKIGSTIEDFYNNKWIKLTAELETFHNEHTSASIEEVLNMELDPVPERTLEQAKAEKIAAVVDYDNSNNVNSFTVGNVEMWLTVDERLQLATLIRANESVGREEMTKWFNGTSFTFSIMQWKQMLIALEVYAGDALNVTENHKVVINNLTTVEEVDSYDYTIGYPEKLIFNL